MYVQFYMDVESMEDGFLAAILAQKGEEFEVGKPIAVVCDEKKVHDEV
jgi:pyruvate/2-oxoglutarate dehydrogenase complex dihydrolipoamide acyltransferase (E2) component